MWFFHGPVFVDASLVAGDEYRICKFSQRYSVILREPMNWLWRAAEVHDADVADVFYETYGLVAASSVCEGEMTKLKIELDAEIFPFHVVADVELSEIVLFGMVCALVPCAVVFASGNKIVHHSFVSAGARF